MEKAVEKELRQKIVDEAATWIGTPFVHEARVKGAGVDCGNLLIAVYEDLNLVPRLVIPHYPADFMMHSDREWFLEIVLQYAYEIPGDPLPGDVTVFRHGRLYSHGAVVVEWPMLIHASIKDRIVAWGNASQYPFIDKKKRFFRWNGFKS